MDSVNTFSLVYYFFFCADLPHIHITASEYLALALVLIGYSVLLGLLRIFSYQEKNNQTFNGMFSCMSTILFKEFLYNEIMVWPAKHTCPSKDLSL